MWAGGADSADAIDVKTKLDPARISEVLNDYHTHLSTRSEHHLGYPYNLSFQWEELGQFLKFSINNLGDPFNVSNYAVHSRTFEVAVLNFFADLYRIPRNKFWGYVTTCGTEGNLLALLYARYKFPDGVLYCSSETHYSVPKAAMMYRIPYHLVDTQPHGEMDYKSLTSLLGKNKDKPAIICCNAGTTMKGASDNIMKIRSCCKRAGIDWDDLYLHVDGALSGLITPFVDTPEGRQAAVSFQDGIDSISVSGHKMLVCPMPCGVVITKKVHMERFGTEVEYLNSTDTTIMGSRNGQAALCMWYALANKGLEGFQADVQYCIDNAHYLKDLFDKAGIDALLNPFSTTVVFPQPSTEMITRWQLACSKGSAHVVVMPNVDRPLLTKFFKEYMAERGEPTDDAVQAKL